MTTLTLDTTRIQAAIEALHSAAPRIRTVLVARNDGLPLVQTALEGDPARTAAMAATTVSLAKRIVGTLGAGELTETSIAGTGGVVLLYAAGPRAVLAVITEPKANVALINFKARVTAQTIAGELATP